MVKRAKLRKITAGLLAFMLVTSALPVGVPIGSGVSFGITASAADGNVVASGYCGKNGSGQDVEWELTENGTLSDGVTPAYKMTITGSGEMADYDFFNQYPWNSYVQHITSVDIAYGVTSIGAGAFFSCSELKSVNIPNSVKSIGRSAFYSCSALTSVTIPNSVTSIGESAFYYCSSLTSVTIPDSVESIGGAAFLGCKNLESVTIPNSVTSIGGAAFYKCSSLTSVTIPDSVTSIGDNTFYECSKLKSVTIGKNVTSIGISAFLSCSELKIVNIGENVTSIGRSAFYKCSALESVTIPDGVESIGAKSFYKCSALKSVTIGKNVTSIGESSFSDCSALKSVTIPCSVKSFGSYVFDYCPDTLKYHLVEGSYADNNITSTNKVYDQYHSFIGTVTKEPSETEEGVRTYKCTGCDYVKTEPIDKVAHTHAPATDWTSDETGHWHTCAGCTEKVDFAAHTSDNGTVTKPATETEEGVKTYKCTVCDYVIKTEPIPTIHEEHTHNYAAEWSSDNTSHWHQCSCGDKTDIGSHVSNGGIVTVQSTYNSTGLRTYSCTVCGYVMHTETIPALKQDYYPNYIYDDFNPFINVTPAYSFEQIKLTGKISKNNVILEWADVEDADKYTVYQLIDGKYKAIKTTAENTYTVENLPTGKYKFIVRYTVDGRISPISKCNSLNVNIKNSKPYPVATVKNNVVTLKWQPVDNAEKYAIYLVKDGKAAKLKETEKRAAAYVLESGKEYQFAVSAYVDGKWTTMKTSDIVKVTAEE